MEDEVRKIYEEVKDKISEEDFLKELNEFKENDKDSNGEAISFNTDVTYANMVVGKYRDASDIVKLSETDEFARIKINELEPGDRKSEGMSVVGRVMSISNPKLFKTRQGKPGKLANVVIADDTGSLRLTFWTENIKLLKNFEEGDVVRVNNVDIKSGYNGGIEGSLRGRSTVNKLNDADFPDFPKYEEVITKIEDIGPDETVNIIAKITRIPAVRTYEKNGKEGKVTSLELRDDTGDISYTLWNNNVDLIKTLELQDGDTVKILGAQSREGREGEIGLTHWDGRIIKGDYDVDVDVSNPITPIAEVKEQDDVNVLGIVTKIQDVRTFTRNDGSDGKVRSFDLTDETGSIRVTVWGDTADDENIAKCNVLKIVGGNARFDDYSPTDYSLNVGWNTQITQVTNLTEDQEYIFEEIKQNLGPVKIESLQNFEDEEGVEVDVMGRILSCGDLREYQRDDGSVGLVRSVEFADETGSIRLSLWADKAEFEFTPGDPYLFENARLKFDSYDIGLNIGSSSRILKLNEEQAFTLPSFETLEEMIYDRVSIDEIDEDDRNILVIARIIDVYEPREFNRQDGETGLVRNIEISDGTGTIGLVLWNEDAEKNFEEGEAIKIQNPSIRYNDNNARVELQIGGASSLLHPSEKELANLPSYAEIEEDLYQPKDIASLEDNDSNVRISGYIEGVSGDSRVLLTKCPACNASVDEFGEEEYICDNCGAVFDEPKRILMIPAIMADDTGDISITFFNNLAEELIGMSIDEIAALIDESDDFGVLEGKIEDLEGLNLEIIANVTWDEFREENRLNPKKILSKSY